MAYPHALQTALFRAGRSATGAVLGRRAAHYTQAALAVDPDKRRRLCADCAVTVVRENFDAGRKAAQRPESVAKRAATQRMHKQAIQDWKPSDQLGWLTRDVYVQRVQPELVHVAEVPDTCSAGGERTVLLSYPGRRARTASTALAGVGETGGNFGPRRMQ